MGLHNKFYLVNKYGGGAKIIRYYYGYAFNGIIVILYFKVTQHILYMIIHPVDFPVKLVYITIRFGEFLDLITHLTNVNFFSYLMFTFSDKQFLLHSVKCNNVIFPLIDTIWVVFANPLTPAVQSQPSLVGLLLAFSLGVANEDMVSWKPYLGQCP